jgi:anaerobic magnesium-protoporphyrin IX monomethyl ester cyclase
MKVLLIFPMLDKDVQFHHLPLSLLALAAPLEKRGIHCEIYDERVDDQKKMEQMLEAADVIGITMFTGYQTTRAYEILKQIKSRNRKHIVVAGGPHVTSLPEEVLNSGLVDYVVVGYGEEAFCRLIEQLSGENTKYHAKIAGVGYVGEDGLPIINKSKYVIDNEYWHPLPYNKINIDKYINPETEMVMYVTMYGCPGKCTFCATPCTMKCIQKPIDIVISDLKALYDRYRYRMLVFNDATFFVNKRRMFTILGSLKEYAGMQWCAFSRADEIVKYSIDELREIKSCSGELVSLAIGLESGSSYVAEGIMKKGKNHLEKFKECIKKLVEVGIPVTSGLIFGVPGERPEDVQNTIKYISEIRDIYPGFKLSTTFFKPLPGTELFNELDLGGFVMPKTLEAWAGYASQNHYKYNEWMDIPWLTEEGNDGYRKLYKTFVDIHGDIVV